MEEIMLAGLPVLLPVHMLMKLLSLPLHYAQKINTSFASSDQ